MLAEAEERGQLSPSEYRTIRDSIWDASRSPTELKKELVERFPKPAPEPRSDDVVVRRLAFAARKLAAEMKACKRVPRAVVERADALAQDVEELASSVRA